MFVRTANAGAESVHVDSKASINWQVEQVTCPAAALVPLPRLTVRQSVHGNIEKLPDSGSRANRRDGGMHGLRYAVPWLASAMLILPEHLSIPDKHAPSTLVCMPV